MRSIAVLAMSLLILSGAAHAGTREDCVASTGATKGAAFSACVAASKAAAKPRTSGYGSGAARRGSCRMSGTC